ncbi:MAG: prolyl oligopeptidase family serine peptidase [Hyphomonadaceae bacterium]|nr:prolyl oligopeptidase family serine peptidase [Hyphomonadaceae bacterium]
MASLVTRLTFAAAALMACAACETAPVEGNVAATTASAAPTAPEPAAPQANLSPEAVKAGDEFLWLEEVNGERALQWVREENKKTAAVLEKDERYDAFRKDALAILTAQDRIPTPSFRGDSIDNFWQDQKSVRGMWRRTTLDSYRSEKPKWQTVLDIDALARSEKANWIYKGADCLPPEEQLCLVSLSDGGKDAVVVREYDVAAKRFVRDGFSLPEGKHRVTWLDKNNLLVATDFGPGSLTESGYPFIVKTLLRGEELAKAPELYRGSAKDGGYGVDPYVLRDGAGRTLAVLVSRPLDTFRSETLEIVNGRAVKLNLPERVTIRGALGGGASNASPRLVFTVEEAWAPDNMAKVGAGALMAVGMRMLRPPPPGVGLVLTKGDTSIFEPTARQSVEEVVVFDDRVVASVYDNVRGRAVVFTDKGEAGGWSENALPSPENSAIHLGSSSRDTGRIFYTHEGFLTPSTLSLADVKTVKADVVKQAPERFDASKDVVEQFEATSKDGTKVPYFVVRPKDAPMDGSTPTLMFGYGGFQVSYPPSYKPELGKLWLERGGAYVLANIRGGGEFGPAWHQSALKGNRQRAFDDFAAVAADLATRKITSAKHLAIYGRSNGGVLTSVTLTQHPELIGGAVIESPLVDMLRYHELPPGASWMGEYGDPRIPAEAAFIARYSGYQNVKPDMKYSEVYITTNTRDDRVHPGHARKFAAKLQAMGYPALYYENTDGGHSNDSDPIVNSKRWARHYVYLGRQLGLP